MDKSVSTEPERKIYLEPMNLHNTNEFKELLRQRVLCGWDLSPSSLEAWRAAADAHTISMFWVVPTSVSQLPTPKPYAGHVMMQIKTDPVDGKPIQHLFNLFVLPEHRRGGLGRAAVVALEAWAKVPPYGSPGCKEMSLNALSRRYIENDGEEWRGMYTRLCASLGIDIPVKGLSNEDWYTKMGYIKYEEQPMYPILLDGEKMMLVAALMRKPLA